ncbi:MAG: DinB family protein [Anaerolineae bacterium]
MTLTLLFDLDDTLLDTNMPEFIPAYFKSLANRLSSWVAPDTMLPALMAGTKAMLANEDPTRTLEDVFDAVFYPALGVRKDALRPAIEEFYRTVFRDLSTITRPRLGARELVEWALASEYRVAIATDPIFPLAATHERIRWAGLDPAQFELISAYEAFHFSKWHAEYYAELLGRMGWPDGPVLMVGNDVQRDLARAEELGLRTYQVDGVPITLPLTAMAAAQPAQPLSHGSLVGLREWLEAADFAALEPDLKSRRAITAVLTSTPAVLQGLTAGLSAEQWKHEPTSEDWSIIEIVSHLRDTEREVHQAQIETLRSDPQPFVPRPDAAVWAKQRHYLGEDGPRAVADFAAARLQTLQEIANVDADLWNRSARHAIFGPTNFGEVVGFMADHDRLHIQQGWQTLLASG